MENAVNINLATIDRLICNKAPDTGERVVVLLAFISMGAAPGGALAKQVAEHTGKPVGAVIRHADELTAEGHLLRGGNPEEPSYRPSPALAYTD